MRSLRRPMFRYGGDVKAQGVMHGMKNMQDGGPATMADATGLANGGMPNMRGRVTGPGGYAGNKESFLKRNYGKLMTGAGAAYNAPDILEMLRFFYKDGGVAGLPPMRGMVTGPGKYSVDATKFGGALKGGLKEDIEQRIKKNPTKAAKIGTYAVPAIKAGVRKYLPSLEGAGAKGLGYLKNFYNTFRPKGLYPQVTQSAGSSMKYAPSRYTTMELLKNPKLLGKFALQNKAPIAGLGYAGLTEPGQAVAGLAAKGAVGVPQYILEALTPKSMEKYIPDVYGKVFKGKPFYGDKKVPAPGEGGTGNVPDAVSGTRKLTQAEIDAKTKADEDIKLKRIYSLLGVDRAQRGAASKALADMSRYIDEGGKDTISRKNIGSTLTKGILAFDKRLDKVDQLKEAAGLMMAKGEIEKDLYKEKGNAATQAIDALAAASGKSKGFIANAKLGIANTAAEAKSQLASTKGMTVTHDTLVPVIRNYAENSGKEFKKQYTTDQKNQKVGKGKDYATVTDLVQSLDLDKNGSDDGIYVVGTSIIEVEKGVAKLTG